MVLHGFAKQLIKNDDATLGVNAGEPKTVFIRHPHEITRRGMAESQLEAAALGNNVYKIDIKDENGVVVGEKRVVIKTEPLKQKPGISQVRDGEDVDTWGRKNLARNNDKNPRRMENARDAELPNMDELEPRAGRKYGYISKALRDDAHHIVGISPSARYKRTLNPESRAKVEAMAEALGLYGGDHPRNISAVPGTRAIRRPNLHLSVIHAAKDPRSISALLNYYGLPDSTHKNSDLVSDIQKSRQFNSQREAAAIADMAIQRLSLQLAMLDPKRVGSSKTINQSKELIERALANTREMGPIDVRPSVKKLVDELRELPTSRIVEDERKLTSEESIMKSPERMAGTRPEMVDIASGTRSDSPGDSKERALYINSGGGNVSIGHDVLRSNGNGKHKNGNGH